MMMGSLLNKRLKLLNNWWTPKRLNIAGLLLGIIGVIIIFCYGPPQPSFDPNRYLSEPTQDKSVLVEKAKYDVWSKLGLGLIALGFGCQLYAAIKQ